MRNRFSIDVTYDVHTTHDVFRPGNATLANTVRQLRPFSGPTPCLLLIDQGLAEATPRLCEKVQTYTQAYPSILDPRMAPCILPGGETTKTGWHALSMVIDLARTAELCRHSLIVALGGGAFLDAVGFAAAMLHRGIPILRLPTTVLAQNDSGVGVKCGINLDGSKNLLGAFVPPAAVINDPLFLLTLSQRDWIAGIAEAFKVGCVCDRAFLDWLAAHGHALRERRLDVMEILIDWCARLHCRHITEGGDPFELGSSRPLDFGHWAGHRLEMIDGCDLRHGEAVAIGIALDLLYAAGQDFISTQDAHDVIRAMKACGLPVWHEALKQTRDNIPDILQGIEEFRQHLGGTLHITFPAPLGTRLEVHAVDHKAMTRAIDDLKRLA